MNKILYPRARGLVGVRAEGADANTLLTQLNTTFEAFKAQNDLRLKELEKGRDDVVAKEHVDRINADVTALQASMDEVNVGIAALKVGGATASSVNPAVAEHATAFNKFFRKGVEAGLRDLEVKASLHTASDPDGGYVVTPEIEKTIDRVLGTVSAIRGISTVRSIGSAVYKKLVSQGGAVGGWVGETDARPDTAAPSLSALEFPAMELYANPSATQGMLDDANFDIAAWLSDEVTMTFAEMEGAAFVSGTGVNQPRGFASYTKVADANYVWGKTGFVTTGVAAALSDATHDGGDALTDLVYAPKTAYRNNARFVMNRKTAAAIRKLKTIGDTEVPLWQPSLQLGQPASLMGYPITDDDNMDDIGAGKFPVAFGDFKRGYLVVDRIGIRILRDPFTNKPYVSFYTTKRVGGGVQDFAAFKLLKCST